MTCGFDTIYMEESLAEVQKTLYEAIGLVMVILSSCRTGVLR